MNKHYVAENLEDFLEAEQAAAQVRFVGDAGRDPYLNQRTIMESYVDENVFLIRAVFLRSLGIMMGDIPLRAGNTREIIPA